MDDGRHTHALEAVYRRARDHGWLAVHWLCASGCPVKSFSVDDRVAALFESSGDEPRGNADLVPYAPPRPQDFWGKVTYVFQAGRLVNVTTEQTLKVS